MEVKVDKTLCDKIFVHFNFHFYTLLYSPFNSPLNREYHKHADIPHGMRHY